jgi:uncharacterized protein
MTKFFLDTYALVEIIQGNPKYKKYLKSELSTSIFNLYELYYNLLRDFNDETAKKYFMQFKQILIHFTDSDVFHASKFKLEHKKQKLSYTDCLGYGIALRENMKFLTGDKEFKNISNVEFMPK